MNALDRGTLDLFVMPDNSFSEIWILGWRVLGDLRDLRDVCNGKRGSFLFGFGVLWVFIWVFSLIVAG